MGTSGSVVGPVGGFAYVHSVGAAFPSSSHVQLFLLFMINLVVNVGSYKWESSALIIRRTLLLLVYVQAQ